MNAGQADLVFAQNKAGGAFSVKLRTIKALLGREAKVTPVFDTYWRFAVERQDVFMNRFMGAPPPWTTDIVLLQHRFTNVYRAADRVSQFLIRHVIYQGAERVEEVFFRILLFKLFNRIETWRELMNVLDQPSWKEFSVDRYGKVMDGILGRGDPVYSAAYIMPPPDFGNKRKHRNHLELLEYMMRSGAPQKVMRAKSLAGVFDVLHGYPSIGEFLAFQFAIDLNYSMMLNFSEMDFVVAGPGARSGIRKCFADPSDLSDEEIIRLVADLAEPEFQRLGLRFRDLWGRRLQLIDYQNIFCEVDKYSRIVHPEYNAMTGRTRIKQKFVPKSKSLPQWYPPKWNLNHAIHKCHRYSRCDSRLAVSHIAK